MAFIPTKVFAHVKSQIWSTQDGASWTQAGTAPIAPSTYTSYCIHNGKHYITYIYSGAPALYESIDGGVTWTNITSQTNFATVFNAMSMTYYSFVSFKGSLYIIAGTGNNTTSGVAVSNDNGRTWSIVNTNIVVGLVAGNKSGMVAVDINGTLFLYNTTYASQFDGYKSTDGVNWEHFSVTVSGTTLYAVSTTSYGFDGTYYYLRTDRGSLKSTDGINWTYTAYPLSGGVYNKSYSAVTSIAGRVLHVNGGTTATANIAWILTTGTFASPTTYSATWGSESNPKIAVINETAADLTGKAAISSTSKLDTTAGLLEIYLQAATKFSDVSKMEAKAETFILLPDLQATIKVSDSASLKTKAIVFESLIDGKVVSIPIKSEIKSFAETIDPSAVRVTISNIVKSNNIPIPNAKVLAIRNSDLKVFQSITDSNGAWSLSLEAGTYHITCVYQDGSQNVFGLVKPYVVIQ